MNIFKRVFVFVLFLISLVFVLAFSSTIKVLAKEIEVDHVASKTEKLKEKITLFIKFDKSKKADYYLYLTEKRLAELIFVVESENLNLVEETASRYATYLGQLSNFVKENKLSSKKDSLNEIFSRHTVKISELQKNFKYDSGWWLAIQHDLNTILLLKDQVKGL